VTGYYADLSNLIVTTGRYPNLTLLNIGRALNRGLEANVRWRAMRRVNFTSGYAYLKSTNLGPSIPGHKVNYGVDLDLGKTWLHFGGVTVGPMWVSTRRDQRLGGFTLATLKWTLPLHRHYSLFAMVDNLLNRHYEVLAGYPMPGANAAGGIDLKF
jgi:iron complex outermembrane receptor protein